MKVGLSNHQPVCLSPLITFEPVGGFREILYADAAIQGDLEVTFFNLVV
jgi:hypothetical protein